MKKCSKCGNVKNDSEFKSSGGRLRSKCIPCLIQYQREYNLVYGEMNRDKLKEYQRRYRAAGKHKVYRVKFLEMYGGKCECCGEMEEVFLALDHKKGNKRRISNTYKSYVDATKTLDNDEYRILCHNCNMATKGGNICPHQKSSI